MKHYYQVYVTGNSSFYDIYAVEAKSQDEKDVCEEKACYRISRKEAYKLVNENKHLPFRSCYGPKEITFLSSENPN